MLLPGLDKVTFENRLEEAGGSRDEVLVNSKGLALAVLAHCDSDHFFAEVFVHHWFSHSFSLVGR